MQEELEVLPDKLTSIGDLSATVYQMYVYYKFSFIDCSSVIFKKKKKVKNIGNAQG